MELIERSDDFGVFRGALIHSFLALKRSFADQVFLRFTKGDYSTDWYLRQ